MWVIKPTNTATQFHILKIVELLHCTTTRILRCYLVNRIRSGHKYAEAEVSDFSPQCVQREYCRESDCSVSLFIEV